MAKEKAYIFTSERLGFRNWIEADIPLMIDINSDPEVMEFFPGISRPEQTREFIDRMQKQFCEKGYCYFAVDALKSNEFIGFIGISEQTFKSEFTPFIDIGWRLNKIHWGKGYATEGAKRCIEYGFINLKLKNIKAVAPKANLKSERVMQKIGMRKMLSFEHPLLLDNERLKECILYQNENKEQQ